MITQEEEEEEEEDRMWLIWGSSCNQAEKRSRFREVVMTGAVIRWSGGSARFLAHSFRYADLDAAVLTIIANEVIRRPAKRRIKEM